MAKQFLSGEQAGILVHAIADRLDEVASAAGSTKPTNNLIPITYSELVSLRDSSKLYPGATYRITDYKCSSSDANTTVASNKFDILVKAIATNKLSEHCGAMRNASDTHFPTVTNFDAWEAWYCLDNDTTRFGWASTYGKGVIYRLIDEFGNDCPYDFKNIVFERSSEWLSNHEDWCKSVFQGNVPTSERLYFTFSLADANLNGTDLSINYHNGRKYLKFYQNKIAPYYSDGVQKLNGNVFILKGIDNTGCYSNTFGINCHSSTFGIGCSSNTFGNDCYSNTFGNGCYSNTFGSGCNSNTFGNDCYSNTFGAHCHSNTFGDGCKLNSFGDSCASNIFGAKCTTNFFGNGCYTNNFMSSCSFNTLGNDCNAKFGNNCVSNTFGNSCISNTFGDQCSSNTFGNNSRSNSFGKGCSYNFFENYCGANKFLDNCSYNTFGNDCGGNKFGNGCSYNTFGNSCYDNIFGSGPTPRSYYRYNCFEDGVQHILFYTTQTTSSTSFLQNITIHRGVKGSPDSNLKIPVPDVNKNYNREYGRNASGTLVNWIANA